jgi:hypothetical protein
MRRGDKVKITAPLGGGDEDGETVLRKGDEGTVTSVNPEYVHKDTGENMVAVDVPGVGLAAVPKRAIRRATGRRFFFFGS